MKILLLALTFIYTVPLENLKGEVIGEITVEDDAPDGSQFIKCKQLDEQWLSCLLRTPSGSEYWIYFPDQQ